MLLINLVYWESFLIHNKIFIKVSMHLNFYLEFLSRLLLIYVKNISFSILESKDKIFLIKKDKN